MVYRYALNIKGAPYKTIWLEYLEIEGEYKKAGIAPSGKRGGKDLYTCPGLVDPNTGTALADSQAIAEYIEKTYPNPSTPTLFPPGTRALQVRLSYPTLSRFAQCSCLSPSSAFATLMNSASKAL